MSEFRLPGRLRGVEKSLIRQLFDRARPNSINLGLGEPDLPTPAVVRRAAARIALEEQNGYTTHAGLLPLRERIADAYAHTRGKPERVIVTAGSQEALYLALMTLVDEGDEVLLPDPGFVAYPTIVRMAGGRPVFYRLPAASDFSFDVAEFRRQLTPRTRVVVLISPSNPTGRALTPADLAAISEALAETGAYLISDEIYRELYYTDERPASVSDHYARTLVIGGLSKSMSMTGWRIGWLCGDEAAIRSALVLHGYVTTCASTLSQKAALEAAWTVEAETARAEMRRTFRERRDYLLSLIGDVRGWRAVKPDGAFYTMVETGGSDSLRAAETLLEHGVITVPGVAFGTEGEGFLRVSFCAEKEVLAEGVRRMARAFS
ncbi:MAG TPA: aminotransferase class I/II-fold pyridoxal phosphate-dependent enzyme [Pyrinomonadaceae bacterium]|nr:aminotransferase class I/II-fold pyridoxal phosphate-dependent enzyme [Pyrinomonadaceae bacterium]